MDEYITVAGIVQFDPRSRNAGGKDVRDVAIRSLANHKMISITVWPENNNVPVKKGDFIVADGKFSQSQGQNKNGEQQTYYNLSAITFLNFSNNAPQPTQNNVVVGAASSDTADDFPF
jgi:hypothetical protein